MFSKYEGIADITLLSRNMLGKSMNSIPLLMNGVLMKCLMWLFVVFFLKYGGLDLRRSLRLNNFPRYSV